MIRQHGENKPDPFQELTGRELNVLRRLAEGKSNADITEALVLSNRTIRNHISIILDKLHVNNRVEAATFAVEHDIRHYRTASE